MKVLKGKSAETEKMGKLCLPERFFSIPGIPVAIMRDGSRRTLVPQPG
jgi:hypothetical protein